MFSVMNSGTCRRPSCTAMFSPTMSGMIIDARDHVTMIALLFSRTAESTFFASLGCTYGPFLIDLDICDLSAYRLCLLRTMSRSDAFLRRVLGPSAGFPHGVFGEGMPIGERPSPPPCG